jgi:hypothetical protein
VLVAGNVKGPVIVGVSTRTFESPFDWRYVETTLSPVLVPYKFAVPTANWSLPVESGLTDVIFGIPFGPV